MSAPPQEGRRAPVSSHPITVLVLPVGAAVYVRFLGPLRQLGTHWTGERSVACLDALICPDARHRLPYTCKWYAAGQEWIDGDNVWRKVVIEITEGLELEFRGRNPRGEVWKLTRKIIRKRRPKEKRDKTKVFGEYLDSVTIDERTKGFDVDPILCHVYREVALPEPLKRNPLPDRPCAEDEVGLPPARLLQSQPVKPDLEKGKIDEETRNAWKEAQARMKGQPAKSTPVGPSPSRNGNGDAHPPKQPRGGES